jgi:uncharacterized OB-fold protein
LSSVVEPRTGRVVAWRDGIPLHYEHTAGVAGEAFLRGLKEGRIVASKCGRCGEVRLPPRTYCLRCYSRTRVDVELYHDGRIASLSTAKAEDGSRTTFGWVTFEGVSGGLLHRIVRQGRTTPRVGDVVRALFLPAGERTGSILDIEGFRTTTRTPRGNR